MHHNDAPGRALTRRSFVAGLLATPVLAACSGGGDDDADGGGGGGSGGSSATSEATTTTAPPLRQPLTGLVHTGDPAVLARPALVVKINNIDTNETARPQAGINQADVVFEERTEGGISRFAAVFHSTDADPVYPVRSARFTDIEICSMLNGPLFANSGGNEAVMEAVRSSNLHEIGNNSFGDPYYYRLPDRPRPHNLASSTPALYSLTPEGAQPPPALFTYREPGTPIPGAATAAGVHVEYGGGTAQSPVEHRFDPALGGWARFQNGTPHVDIAGVQVAPPNVVVQFIEYEDNSGILIGGGEAWVFTGDQLVVGTWSRLDPAVPTTFFDGANAPITLLPGRTWVLLPPPGGGTVL
jgi:hypothetical protein